MNLNTLKNTLTTHFEVAVCAVKTETKFDFSLQIFVSILDTKFHTKLFIPCEQRQRDRHTMRQSIRYALTYTKIH